ncbi:MAG: fused MFS/spermidine synthase [Acidobacteriota bacterium]
MNSSARLRTAAGLLLLSGAGSLILEVVWSRLLRLVFGSTTLAISTVLVAYMLGLGIGGLIGGRFARRFRGLAVYARLELGIAAYALVVPLLLSGLASLWWSSLGDLDFWTSSIARFVLALLALITPTILMGATLPILLAGLIDDEKADSRAIGLLYGANTLGAVIGVLLATFVLFPAVGVRWTNAIGAGFDLAAAALALWLARQVSHRAVPQAAGSVLATTPTRWNLAALTYGVVGATALASEVAWTRGLGMVFGSSTYAFASMLATFLLGIALGSFLIRPWLIRLKNAYGAYAIGMLTFALSSIVALVLLGYSNDLFVMLYLRFGISGKTVLLAAFVLSAVTMILPTLVLGALFPLLATALARERGTARAVGDLYFFNTVGSALGAFLAGFVLIPQLGLAKSLILGASLNAFVAAIVLLWQRDWLGRGPRWLAAGAAVLAVATLFFPPSWSEYKMTRGAYYHPKRAIDFGMPNESLEGLPAETILMLKDGPSATVSIHDQSGGIDMRINGKTDASLTDMSTQVLSGHLPVLFGGPMKTACVIGYASGVTSGALTLYKPERLDIIEIEPAVIDGSRYFESVNHKPLDDPHTRLLIEDGRAWLARTHDTYDVIVSEPSNPFLAGAANLFTREFFVKAHRRLNPGGRLLQWIQLYGLDPQGLSSILAALRGEFAHVYGFHFSPEDGDLLLLASDTPIDAAALPKLESMPAEVRADLERVGVLTTAQLFSLLRLSDEDTKALAANASFPNTDDSMFIELRAPWLLHTSQTVNHALIESFTSSLAALWQRATIGDPQSRADLALGYLLARGDRAMCSAILGPPVAEEDVRLAAVRLVLAQQSSNTSTGNDLERVIDRALEESPKNVELLLLRGEQRRLRGDALGGLDDASRALALAPSDPRARLLRLRNLGALGRFAEAVDDANALSTAPYADYARETIPTCAVLLAGAGRLDQGISLMQRFVDFVRDCPAEWQLLGVMLRQRGRVAEADSADRNATIAARNQMHAYHRQALLALRKGDRAAAVSLLRQLRQLHPGYKPAIDELTRLGERS